MKWTVCPPPCRCDARDLRLHTSLIERLREAPSDAEFYAYSDIKFDQRLGDEHFDKSNSEYRFVRRQ